MAAVHWLTESGDIEPGPVCAVDYSDEGEAVEFAHQLYRSVHGSACLRQGFVIADDGGKALYTWRWTGGDPPETISVEDLAKSLSPRRQPPTRIVARTASPKPAGGQARAVTEALRRGFAWRSSAAPWRRLTRDSLGLRGAFKAGLAQTLTLLRQAQAVWRTMTRWEKSIGPGSAISDATHRAR